MAIKTQNEQDRVRQLLADVCDFERTVKQLITALATREAKHDVAWNLPERGAVYHHSIVLWRRLARYRAGRQ